MFTIYGLSCSCHPERGIRYVGQTGRNLQTRMYEHVWDSTGGRARDGDRNLPVHRWIRKHGAGNILATVLEQCQGIDESNLSEQKWVIEMGTLKQNGGLNVHPGGDSRSGWKHSESAKARIVQSVRSRPGGNRKVPLSLVPEIRKRIIAGDSYANISREMEVPYGSVAGIATGKSYARVGDDGKFDPALPSTRENIRNGHSSHRIYNDDMTRQMLEMLSHGNSKKSVAAHFGVSESFVLKQTRHIFPPRAKLSAGEREEIIRRYQKGETQGFLAAEFGVSRGWLGRLVRGEVR